MERATLNRRFWWGAALFVVTASILAHQILCPPIVGLADNGDFSRITDHLGLTPEAASIEDRYVRFIVPRYSTGPLALRRYMSSEILLAGSARLAALPLSPTGTFDLRWVGMVHSLALLGAAVVLWKASRRLTNGAAVAAGSFAAFAFTDVGYVAPLNSFYAQVASFVFLFWVAALAAVSLADGGRRAWPIAGYFAAAFLFVASKPQEALQSIPLALFGAFLARRPGRRWIAAAGAALLFAASGALFVGTRGGFQQGALYKLVFFEILPRSTDPAADLRALGLDPAAARYSGTTNYGESSPFRDPLVRGSLFPKLGYRALSRFYLTHPARVADELLRGAPAGMNLCASYGNFAKSAGLAPGAQSGAYRAWTKLRLLGVGSAPLVLGLIYGANLLLSLAGRVPAAARVSLATLVAMGALAFAVCTLFSAQIDLPRKLYVFHAITDLLLVADLALAGRAAAALRAK